MELTWLGKKDSFGHILHKNASFQMQSRQSLSFRRRLLWPVHDLVLLLIGVRLLAAQQYSFEEVHAILRCPHVRFITYAQYFFDEIGTVATQNWNAAYCRG